MSTTESTAETATIIDLHCPDWRTFADTYAADLERGALCVAHTAAVPLLSGVTVRISLPDALSVTLNGRVVQVIDGPQAQQQGGSYALALELLELEGERRQQLAQLLAFARAQRDGDETQPSFTHRLLQISPSMPPREVGLRLSQMPAVRGASLPPRASKAPANQPASAAEEAGDSGYRHSAALRGGRDDITRPLSPARERARHSQRAPAQAQAQPSSPAKPTDPLQLKELLSSVAHKHYGAALRIANQMLESNSGDVHARRWRALCHARIALGRNDVALAVKAYEAVLEVEPNDREAREYVKAHERAKKLESLPFGRFFTRKK